MIRPDISVVMGAKNRKNLIKATIDSIRNNGFNGNIEIVVIDGGSTDGTCDWLAKQKDVFTIIQPNYSVVSESGIKVKAHSWGEFMNIGFKAAHSDYICMVSDDLILAPGCLQKGYDEIRQRIDNGEKIGGGAFYFREYPRNDYFRVIKLAEGNVNINHGFYYRPALEAVNWLDEKTFNFYNGDGDVAMRLNMAGWKTIVLKDCFALHLVHLPKRKQTLPAWYLKDMEAYENLYGHLGQGSLDISEDTPPINPRPFWRYALRNVLTGYLLREYDKRKMNAK